MKFSIDLMHNLLCVYLVDRGFSVHYFEDDAFDPDESDVLAWH